MIRRMSQRWFDAFHKLLSIHSTDGTPPLCIFQGGRGGRSRQSRTKNYDQYAVRIAYRKEFATEPLADGLRRRGWETVELDPYNDGMSGSALLIAGDADLAMTPALEYASSIGIVDYALAPHVAITTRGFAGQLKLVFKPGLMSFETIAVKGTNTAEEQIARILLSEKHDITPRSIRFASDASLEQMLAAADCALLVGDDAIFHAAQTRSLLDLTDEWGDEVQSPLPYMVIWGKVGELPQGAVEDLIAARDEAVLTLADRAAQHERPAEAAGFYQHYLRGEITYELGEEEIAALEAFFRYTFYYSVIPDIPAVKFLPDGEPPGSPARSDIDC